MKCHQLCNAFGELEDYAIERKDGGTIFEVKALSSSIKSWSFIISIVVWYDLLFHINKASNFLQSPTHGMNALYAEIKATEIFLRKYQQTVFTSAHASAHEIAESVNVEREFPARRGRRM